VIVILDVSRGADVEIDHFVMNVPGIRDRLFVLLPAEHADSNGLANRVLDRLDRETQVREFTQNQLEDSVVASQMAVECALEIVMERAARAEAWLRV
jgi:hypothetical protein